MDFYTGIYAEKEIALWKIWIAFGLWMIVSLVPLAISNQERGLLFGIFVLAAHIAGAAIAWAIFLSGNYQLKRAYREFCEHRIIPFGRGLNASYPAIHVIVPRRRAFRRSNDLRTLEERTCEYLRDDQRYEEAKIRKRRRAAQCERLQPELIALIDSPGLTDKERGLVLEIGTEIRDPEAKKRFIARIRTELAQRAFAARNAANAASRQVTDTPPPQPAAPVVDEDRRLKLLEAQAEACTSGAAQALYRTALKTTERREQTRLLKKAVHAEEEAARREEAVAAQAKERPEPAPRPQNDVRYVDLNQLLEDRFRISHLVPKGVDATMAKEILIVLLEPGKLERKFQNSYRKESRVKRRVVNRYGAWVAEPFDPKSFRETLGWLLREGVLRAKPKDHELVYSLSANTRETEGEDARALIAAVLRFDDEIRNGKMW